MSAPTAPSDPAGGFRVYREAATMLTLAEVDEALGHARAVPVEKRGAAWQAYVDSLLEMRQMLTPSQSVTFSR